MWRSAIMAEVIQERVEDRLPELEQLERTGLFSHAEIKAIIRKALELEYRIQRRSLLKDDFIRYVQYEINLLDLIEKRRAVSNMWKPVQYLGWANLSEALTVYKTIYTLILLYFSLIHLYYT